ncbi:MAG: hypothetical protein AAGA38_03635 [Pseudomonadota bacterium]
MNGLNFAGFTVLQEHTASGTYMRKNRGRDTRQTLVSSEKNLSMPCVGNMHRIIPKVHYCGILSFLTLDLLCIPRKAKKSDHKRKNSNILIRIKLT